MEEFENRIFDLLEAKAFDQLNSAEKSFVLKHLSEEEYQLQRRIMTEADEMPYEPVEPLPLASTAKRTSIFTRTIPMYQALIGAACMLIGFFLFSSNSGKDVKIVVSPSVFSLVNDASAPQFVHDTVIRFIPEKGTVKRVIHDTISITEYVLRGTTPTRMLEAGNFPYPRLDQSLLETKSQSAKDDGSVGLLPKVDDFSSMK